MFCQNLTKVEKLFANNRSRYRIQSSINDDHPYTCTNILDLLLIYFVFTVIIFEHYANYGVVRITQNGLTLPLQWTDCIMDTILKKVEVGKFITTALKSILKLVKLQSLVAKCCKMRKI